MALPKDVRPETIEHMKTISGGSHAGSSIQGSRADTGAAADTRSSARWGRGTRWPFHAAASVSVGRRPRPPRAADKSAHEQCAKTPWRIYIFRRGNILYERVGKGWKKGGIFGGELRFDSHRRREKLRKVRSQQKIHRCRGGRRRGPPGALPLPVLAASPLFWPPQQERTLVIIQVYKCGAGAGREKATFLLGCRVSCCCDVVSRCVVWWRAVAAANAAACSTAAAAAAAAAAASAAWRRCKVRCLKKSGVLPGA